MNSKKDLVKHFVRRRKYYIIGLSGIHPTPLGLPTDEEEKQAYFEGMPIYEKLKDQGKIPVYCRVLENIWECKREQENSEQHSLKGKVEHDFAYRFLQEVREKVERLAYLHYKELHGPMPPRGKIGTKERMLQYEYVEDQDVFVNGKREFVDSLISLMQNRSFVRRGQTTCSWYQDVALDEGRYNWLRSAGLMGDKQKRNKMIKDFVTGIPGYGWERFHWDIEG